MAGLYIHIPYCKQACHYCDFHFSTNVTTKTEVIKAIKKEIALKSNLGADKVLNSIYFGGGTPSLLSSDEICSILNTSFEYFEVSEDAEITFECNPDDISTELLKSLKKAGINRISLGIQSFHNDLLVFMNRAHDAHQATRSIELIKDSEINNLSTDLIFAIPGQTLELLEQDINTLLHYNPEHISTYCLSIEPQTVFDRWHQTGKLKETGDEKALEQYLFVCNKLQEAGYIHYEVSNFALPGRKSRHNSSYWKGAEYIGVGPGAHSFYNNTRYNNIAHNIKYKYAILEEDKIPEEKEILSEAERFNEYIMVKLRTKEGVQSEEVRRIFSIDFFNYFSNELKQFEEAGLIRKDDESIVLTDKGFFLSDEILIKLFLDSHSL